MQHLDRHGGHQRDERPGQQREQRQGADRQPYAWIATGKARALADPPQHRQPGWGGRRWQPDGQQGTDHRKEGQGIQGESPGEAAQQDRRPGHGRPDHPPEVPLCGGEGDSAQQLLLGHEVGQDSLVGGEAHSGDAAAGEEDQRDGCGGRRAVRGDHSEQGGEQHRARVGADQQPPALDAIGQRAAERAEYGGR